MDWRGRWLGSAIMTVMKAPRSIQKRHIRNRNPPHAVSSHPSAKKELVMKLYGFPPSPNTWQVRALASYLGVPLEFEFVDLTKGGAQTPAFLAIVSHSLKSPSTRVGVRAVMQYIAGKKPNAAW